MGGSLEPCASRKLADSHEEQRQVARLCLWTLIVGFLFYFFPLEHYLKHILLDVLFFKILLLFCDAHHLVFGQE